LATIVSSAEAAGVPAWVKNNAGWWADGTIADSDFITGIQYLIEEGIITIPSTTRSASTSDAIPDWVKIMQVGGQMEQSQKMTFLMESSI